MDPLTLLASAASLIGFIQQLSSAIRLYEGISWSVGRYKEWSTDQKHIQLQIRTQRTIFRNECRLVLASLFDHEVAKKMMENREHPTWADPDLDFKFTSHFGASSPIYSRVVHLIKEKLVLIEREVGKAHFTREQLPFVSVHL
jgi:hypothetical protein